MSTEFDRELTGFRFIETRRGDSLQVIAARELGDGSRWTELVAYNNLVPPFLVDDEALAGPGVIVTGASILAPAPTPVASSTIDPEAVFGTDMRLDKRGGLLTANGDFVVVSGRANLSQALKNRVETRQGELVFHKNYGSKIRRLLGTVGGPTRALLAAQYAKSAVQRDPRVSKVENAIGTVDGDAVRVDLDAIPVTGKVVPISAAP